MVRCIEYFSILYRLHYRSYSFVCTLHHLIIIIVQTHLKTLNYKTPVRYILSSVSIRLRIFSPLSIIQYVGLYVFSLPMSLVMIEIIYILCLIIIIKSEVWTITHCLGLGHETIVPAVCLSIFLLHSFICGSLFDARYTTMQTLKRFKHLRGTETHYLTT